MDRIDAMRVFTRVVELRSFSRTADQLDLPRATVTHAIQALEARLGLRLLERTTRHVSPSLEGAAYYERCLRLLADFEDAEALGPNAAVQPRGKLRIDLHAALVTQVVIPMLPDFLARHPGIALDIGTDDRPVELVREGVDCTVRGGVLKDASLLARRLTDLPQLTCASPGYLARHGTPPNPEALADDHSAVNYFHALTGQVRELEFSLPEGGTRAVLLPSQVAVNSPEAYVAACVAGLGLIQLPRHSVQAQLDAGALVEVLPAWCPPPLPVSVLYPHARQFSPRVRVFVDWLAHRLQQRSGGVTS